jgi:hypothetical protein
VSFFVGNMSLNCDCESTSRSIVVRNGNDIHGTGTYLIRMLPAIVGGVFILAGVWTMVAPPSWDMRMMAFHSAEIAALPKANPLRWFHLFWRFALGSQRRKVLWGTVQIVNGVAWLLGEALLAIALDALLGMAILATYSFRRPSG